MFNACQFVIVASFLAYSINYAAALFTDIPVHRTHVKRARQ